jgi:serine/threonine protein phosphatase 1
MQWIIGDIHGMLRPLGALISAISRRDQAAHFIFVGDYVNRGPDSRKCIDLLLSLPKATFLRGNHDDIFDLLLHGDSYITNPGPNESENAFTWFMQHGLGETLISYGADWDQLEDALREPTARRIAQFVKPVPQSHRRFIRSLKPVYETDEFFVAHGFWSPEDLDVSPGLAAQLDAAPNLRHRLLWNRFSDAQIHSTKYWQRTGYFGHTPVTNYPGGSEMIPIAGPGIVLLDTASALTPLGMLSAACAETGTVIQADRAGKTVEFSD